jgi:membrane-associated phospholipid phosphatase
MNRVVAIALVLAATTAHADPPDPHRKLRIAIGVGALGVFVITETVAKDSLAPSSCRWCQPDSLDAHVRSSLVWGNPASASTLSNYTAFVAPPLGAFAVFFAASGGGLELFDDMTPLFEAAVGTQLVDQVLKFSIGRQRPYAHFTPSSTTTDEDNLSFPSGHTSFAFSIATSAGMVAHRRHYAGEAAVWAGGYALAALSGYLRIAADKHYLTDVLTGAGIGVAGGLFIPQLTHSLPEAIVVTPTPFGVAVVGSF